MQLRSAEECRQANITYHLVPEPVWAERGYQAEYLPDAFEADGFIHCTNGLDPLIEVGNMFYRSDAREYGVLVLDTTRITSEIRYDDEERVYPHIYGPLNTDAVMGRLMVVRDPDGKFAAFREV
jgi:uncharacterized protein (DUF952 family)